MYCFGIINFISHLFEIVTLKKLNHFLEIFKTMFELETPLYIR